MKYKVFFYPGQDAKVANQPTFVLSSDNFQNLSITPIKDKKDQKVKGTKFDNFELADYWASFFVKYYPVSAELFYVIEKC
jgi:hypothetical protein